MFNPTPIPLQSLMRHPVVALRLHETVSAALDIAHEHGVHHFPVCDHDQVVGMVCTCDLQEASADEAVAQMMKPPVTLAVDRSAAEAATLMTTADVGSLLLTDDAGDPCGIVTRSDLVAEPASAALLENCRCESCGSTHHLQRYEGRQVCCSCRERAREPQAFEGGGGD